MGAYLLTHEEISALCLELSMLLHAGVDPAQGLSLVAQETREIRRRELLEQMTRRMDEGKPLSCAVEESCAFPQNVSAMLKVGERTGRSEQALTALAQYHLKRSQAESRLRSALLYPSILLTLMLGVILVLLTKVLPVFQQVYAGLGGEMTGLAGGLLRLGQLLNTALPVLCAVLGAIVLAAVCVATIPPLRKKITGLQRGKLSVKTAQAWFAQGLSMALASGLGGEEALETARNLLDHEQFARRVKAAQELLSQGDSLAKALLNTELLPAGQCRLLELGFAGGSGDGAMAQIAQRMEEEAEEALERLLSRVEPALVVCCSLLVGAILLAVMLPLTRIMAVMG